MRVLLHPSDQPIFRLAVRAAQCRVEIRMNDVPVFFEGTGAALHLDLPVNEWLFQGVNRVEVRLSPVEEGGAFGTLAEVEVVLQHKFARDAVRNVADIGVLRWKPDPEPGHGHGHHTPEGADSQTVADAPSPDGDADEDAVLLALPGQAEELHWRVGRPEKREDKTVRISSTLLLPPPWPVCPWARGQVLPGDASTHFAVSGMVRAFHQRLQQGSYEDLLKLRRTALEFAYYVPPADVDEAFGFPALLRRQEWRLQPLPGKDLKLELAGQGKLARLLDETTGESPLLLVNETEGVAAVLDAWWMFNGDWLMVR